MHTKQTFWTKGPRDIQIIARLLLKPMNINYHWKKSSSFWSCVQLKESTLGFLEDRHFHFRFELKHEYYDRNPKCFWNANSTFPESSPA